MKTKEQVINKIEEVKSNFNELATFKFDINDPESLIDANSAMLASAVSLTILDWFLNDEVQP